MRASLDASIGTISLAAILGDSSSALVHLPIYVEVAPGTAWLVSTQCNGAPAARSSTVGVQSGIANVCVGDIYAGEHGRVLLHAARDDPQRRLAAGRDDGGEPARAGARERRDDADLQRRGRRQRRLPNRVGRVRPTLAYTLQGLSASLSKPGGLVISSSIGRLNSVLQLMSPLVLGVLTPVLSTVVLAGLDQVLVPVLQLLGAQVGSSTVHDLSLPCGKSQLAY